MRVRSLHVAVLCISALLTTGGGGVGQETAPFRQGFFIGGSAGYSSLTLDIWNGFSSPGIGSTFEIGGTINSRFLIGLLVESWNGTRDDGLGQTAWQTVAKFYPDATKGLFLSGGFGVAEMSWYGPIPRGASLQDFLDAYRKTYGVSASAGLGYDAHFTSNWAVAPSAGFAVASGYDSGAFRSYTWRIGVGIIRH